MIMKPVLLTIRPRAWPVGGIVFHKHIVYLNHYTPGFYADGYIVFAFPFVRSSVRMFVHSLVRFFVRNSGTFVEFMSKFWLKFL